MITRIVKMTFDETKTTEFVSIFNNSKELIRGFEGCQYLELFCDKNQPAIYFTYSKWDSEDHLNQYRNSELFATTWAATKALFAGKPEAWTIESKYQLP